MGKSTGRRGDSPPTTTGVHLGSGGLFAIGILVAAVAVYLSSPDGPRQVERCKHFENQTSNFFHHALCASFRRLKWMENETDPQYMTKWVCIYTNCRMCAYCWLHCIIRTKTLAVSIAMLQCILKKYLTNIPTHISNHA